MDSQLHLFNRLRKVILLLFQTTVSIYSGFRTIQQRARVRRVSKITCRLCKKNAGQSYATYSLHVLERFSCIYSAACLVTSTESGLFNISTGRFIQMVFARSVF